MHTLSCVKSPPRLSNTKPFANLFQTLWENIARSGKVKLMDIPHTVQCMSSWSGVTAPPRSSTCPMMNEKFDRYFSSPSSRTQGKAWIPCRKEEEGNSNNSLNTSIGRMRSHQCLLKIMLCRPMDDIGRLSGP